MSDKFFRIMTTDNYIVRANSESEALKLYDDFNPWRNGERTCQELTPDEYKNIPTEMYKT